MLLEFSEVKLKTSSAGFGALGLGLESRMRNTSRTTNNPTPKKTTHNLIQNEQT